MFFFMRTRTPVGPIVFRGSRILPGAAAPGYKYLQARRNSYKNTNIAPSCHLNFKSLEGNLRRREPPPHFYIKAGKVEKQKYIIDLNDISRYPQDSSSPPSFPCILTFSISFLFFFFLVQLKMIYLYSERKVNFSIEHSI